MSDVNAAVPRGRRDWWFWAAAFFLLVELVLYVVPHVWRGDAGLACWMIGGDALLWWFVAGVLFLLAVAWSLFRRPVFNRWRVLGGVLIVLVALAPSAFRVYPSSHEGEVSEVRFRLPLDGPILVGWGGNAPRVNYHVAYPDQRWAYDLLVAKEGKTHAGEGTRFEDYYCYGLPVLAPADGNVVAVLDGIADTPLHAMETVLPAGGNQIVLEVAPHQFLFLCHLKRGSILVKEGETVRQGQPLAQVGNSGNTSEPHLHIHLQDSADPHFGEGIPLYFYGYRAAGKLVERGMPTGGISLLGDFSGQVVEHVDAAD